MSKEPSEKSNEGPSKPGKIRTWWHPMLVNLLRWQLGDAYTVSEELPVGKKPLQIDVVLVKKEEKAEGPLDEAVRQMLAGLADRLNRYTLVELKSPTDTLENGDFRTFIAYALLYCVQTDPKLPRSALSQVVIAPRLTQPYREELENCGCSLVRESPGVWRVERGICLHPFWILETAALADSQHPLLAVFSPAILKDRSNLFAQLKASGHERLMTYMTQQIQQFRLKGEDFAMQYADTESMEVIRRELIQDFIQTSTPEERFEFFQGFAPEHRLNLLKHLPPDQFRAFFKDLPSDQVRAYFTNLPFDLFRDLLKELPPEQRRDLVKEFTPEERRDLFKEFTPEERRDLLKEVTPEERRDLLKDLPLEERIQGLTAEERERLKQLLQRPDN